MDDCRGKSPSSSSNTTQPPASFNLRGTNSRDYNNQYCHRIGCSIRPSSTKCLQGNGQEKKKYSRPSFYAPSRKNGDGCSSRSAKEHKRAHKHEGNSSKGKEGDISSSTAVLGGIVLKEKDNSKTGSDARAQKQVCQSPRNKDEETSLLSGNFSSRNIGQGTDYTCKSQTMSPEYSLQNVNASDALTLVPHGCVPECNSGRRGHVANRATLERRYQSAKSFGKASNSRNPQIPRDAALSPSLRNPLRSLAQHALERVRTRSSRLEDHAASRASRRGVSNLPTPSHSGHANESSLMMPIHRFDLRTGEIEIPFHELEGTSSSLPAHPEFLFSSSTSYSRQLGWHNGASSSRPSYHSEVGNSWAPVAFSIPRGNFECYSVDGITEILMALEGMDRGDELTHEQLLLLETNLLGGMTLHDQHSDLRLDIDNMSYEELLDLEEKMGFVSTALTEKELLACLSRSYYKSCLQFTENAVYGEQNNKCSICQEEYIVGDELGGMFCKHQFHVACIQQWLRQKNWCPICKAPASTSMS